MVGNFFQLSNQTTLGKSEQDLLDHLGKMVRAGHGVRGSRRAQVLLRDAPAVIEDKVWRAYGLLRYARALSFEEAMNLLSGVRLGVGLQHDSGRRLYTLNKMLVFTQPAHLASARTASGARRSVRSRGSRRAGLRARRRWQRRSDDDAG